ncbi:Alpha/Beta hydrolase protein [Choanephora cucurbitarum]|nr:Alpha/Beta hydrolase protein [Choanephora cucurbitarum]
MGHDEVNKQQDNDVASNNTTNKQTDIYDGDDDDDDDKSLTETHFSRQHLDEILGVQKYNRKTHGKKAEPELPQPQNIIEWIILWVYRLQRTTTKQYRPSGYWRYAIGVYQNLFLMFYFNWITIFTAPLSAFAFIFTYPIIAVALFMFEIGLKIFMDGLGGNELVDCISKDFGYGIIINWGAPQLLLSEKSRLLVRNTLPALGKTASESNSIETEDDQRHRTFDVSIAQTMTILGSLVYERQDKKIVEAYRLLSDFNKNKKNIKEADKQYQQIERDMTRLVWESEREIRKIARSYGLHFAGVTDLKSLGDTFCGLFWPIKHENPFIIVAFKGTTPTNYSEFLVDATLQRTDARSYLFGSAHEGFYSSLFSSHFDVDTRDPYYAIQSAIRERATQLQKDSKDPSRPVQVWVAGHSLGAAIGSLLFARWLKCPEDIAPMCELRDAYVIGTPAVGDNDFASMFSSFSNLPLSRASTLWRVINKSDIICRIPPGYNSMTIGHYVSSTDFFNYSHIGHAVQITYPMLHEKPLKIYPSSYQSNLTVDIASSSDHLIPEEPPLANKTQEVDLQSYPWWFRPILKSHRNPISLLESFYPFFLRDHIPIHYFEGLERAQVYYSQQND